eukprot:1759680-Pleurochrysis_carterae.AAC.2
MIESTRTRASRGRACPSLAASACDLTFWPRRCDWIVEAAASTALKTSRACSSSSGCGLKLTGRGCEVSLQRRRREKSRAEGRGSTQNVALSFNRLRACACGRSVGADHGQKDQYQNEIKGLRNEEAERALEVEKVKLGQRARSESESGRDGLRREEKTRGEGGDGEADRDTHEGTNARGRGMRSRSRKKSRQRQCNQRVLANIAVAAKRNTCLLYTSPSPRDGLLS